MQPRASWRVRIKWEEARPGEVGSCQPRSVSASVTRISASQSAAGCSLSSPWAVGGLHVALRAPLQCPCLCGTPPLVCGQHLHLALTQVVGDTWDWYPSHHDDRLHPAGRCLVLWHQCGLEKQAAVDPSATGHVAACQQSEHGQAPPHTGWQVGTRPGQHLHHCVAGDPAVPCPGSRLTEADVSLLCVLTCHAAIKANQLEFQFPSKACSLNLG